MDLEKNRERWRKLLSEHAESEKTIKQFCEDNDVKVHQFKYFRDKFKEEDKKNTQTNFVEVITPKAIIDDQISFNLNGIDISLNQNNLIKLLATVKQLD